jgi:hypothetical protein
MLKSVASVSIGIKGAVDPLTYLPKAFTFIQLADSGLWKADIGNISLGTSFVLSGDTTVLSTLDELVLIVKVTMPARP